MVPIDMNIPLVFIGGLKDKICLSILVSMDYSFFCLSKRRNKPFIGLIASLRDHFDYLSIFTLLTLDFINLERGSYSDFKEFKVKS